MAPVRARPAPQCPAASPLPTWRHSGTRGDLLVPLIGAEVAMDPQSWAGTARPGHGVAGAVSSPAAGLAAGGHRGRAGSVPGRGINRAMDTGSAGNAVLQAWGSAGTARWHGMARHSLASPAVAPPVPSPVRSRSLPRPGGRELTRDPPRYKFCIVRGWGELGGSQGRL